jgi:hypothetical protein
MPTEYWSTDSTFWTPPTYDQWSRVGGSNKSGAVRAGGLYTSATHDDASSYLYWKTYQTWGREELSIDWPGPIGGVTAVTHGARTRHINNGNTAYRVYLISSEGTSNSVGAQTFNEGWTNRVSASTRPGGGSFTASDFVGDYTWARIDCYPDQNSNAERDITTVYGQVTYTPPGDNFIPFFQVLLPLLGSALGMEHMLKLRLALRSMSWRRTWLSDSELEPALRSFKAWTRPRFCFTR